MIEQTPLERPDMKLIDLRWEHLYDENITMLLYNLTGTVYRFQEMAQKQWGPLGTLHIAKDSESFWRIMPEVGNDDDAFYLRYEKTRNDYQDFARKEDALMQFIYYWLKWEKKAKLTEI